MLTSFISLLIQQDAHGGAATAAGQAATTSGEQVPAGGGFGSLIMIVVLIAVFYFLLIRPQQKRQKEIRKQREAMKEGDQVITAGGIHGKITDIKDNAFVISIADGVRIKVDKNSVYPAGTDIQQGK